MPERTLLWDGCCNIRDLGGLPTADGGETRFRAVVRADNVRLLSNEGWRDLVPVTIEGATSTTLRGTQLAAVAA